MNAFIPLHTFLDLLLPLTEDQKMRFSSLFTATTLTKGEHLLRAGDSLSYLYFCLSGCFRLYYSTYDGKERIKSFCAANDFITSYTALLTGEPAQFSIQALQPAKLLRLSYLDLLALTAEDPIWERLTRRMVEGLYMKKERREMQLLTLSAEDRYRCFLEEFGTLDKDIPQYYIASYLGITPVALSRIRAQWRNIRPSSDSINLS
ncbi:Crp/Fnr family transcriptional regulator [Paenibacillus qinlingensis]|uniref:Crp/Fnr family transcriptional regulator n=1 Tax=Paenibacillus qinlingensis TaxID=1837343 RepID=UPI0015660EE3|nr:Crp/Fnr family transcriptional regulator [Paenibacillus qinlingensis]NQX59194.1 Crp/Fnr family transcriptional regulator [Paenibacillus qinlingensis]